MKAAATAASMSFRSRTWRAVAVLAFVALVGPAVGGVMFPGPFYAPQIWWSIATGGVAGVTGTLGLLGYMALFGYVAGLVPALVAGGVMAVATWRRGTFGYQLASLAGLAGAAGMALSILFDGWRRGALDTGTPLGILIFYVPLSVAAALVCRFLLTRFGIVPSSRKGRLMRTTITKERALKATSGPTRANAYRVGAFIALVGPLIGALAMFLVFAFLRGWGLEGADFSRSAEVVGDMLLLIVLFGYLVGGVPAVVAAIWLSRRTFRVGDFGYREAAATAVVAGLVGSLLFEFIRAGWPIPRASSLLIVVPSVVAALACRFLLARLGWIATAPPARQAAIRQ